MDEADQDSRDPATEAFEDVRAVEGLSAERVGIDVPVYSETLAKIHTVVSHTFTRADLLVKSPALAMTPAAMAARSLGLLMRESGQRLMTFASPYAWPRIVTTADLACDNRDAIGACRTSAAKAKKAVRCMIEIKAEQVPQDDQKAVTKNRMLTERNH